MTSSPEQSESRAIMVLSNADAGLEGLKVGKATIKIARSYDSEKVDWGPIVDEIRTYEYADSEEEFKDSKGNHYRRVVLKSERKPSNMFQVISLLLTEKENLEFGSYDIAERGIVDGRCPFYVDDTRYFIYAEWEEPTSEDPANEAELIMDTLRMVKLSNVGFSRIIKRYSDGYGMTPYPNYIPTGWRRNFEKLSLSDKDIERIDRIYGQLKELKSICDTLEKDAVSQHEYDLDPIVSKEGLLNRLLGLNRASYTLTDYNSAFLLQAIIWETVVQNFPSERVRDSKRDMGVTTKIMYHITDLINNNPESRRELVDLMGLLYNQRSEFAHGNYRLRPRCFRYGFDVSRILILKMLDTEDDLNEMVVRLEEYNDRRKKGIGMNDPVPYPSDLHLMKIDDRMRNDIKAFKTEQELRWRNYVRKK